MKNKRVSDESKKGDPFILAWGIYGAIGFQLAMMVVGGLLIGNWLDKHWSTSPWLALTGLILGSIGGFYNLIRVVTWRQQKKP